MSGAANRIGMSTSKRSLENEDIEAGSNKLPVEAALNKIVHGVNNERHDINIDKLVGSMESILEDVPQYMCIPGHPARLSRIPESLREVDIKSYEPYFLSIGPYHHGKARVQQMEKRKLVILKCVLEQKPELTLKDYLTELKGIEPTSRSFYSDVEMGSEKFLTMLLLDSLFILTVFCGMVENRETINPKNTKILRSAVNKEDANERENYISEGENANRQMVQEASSEENIEDGIRWFWTLFEHDLFLIENQLPFFVLQKLFTLAYGGPETLLIDIIKVKVGDMLWHYTKLDSEVAISATDEVHHLLHLCHMLFQPTLQHEPTTCQLLESNQMYRLGSVVQLYEAGVRFVARSDSTPHSLLDITFDSSGILTMPCLYVDDNTNSLLRNLIALEQMKYPSLGLHFSSYVVLLLHLITVPEDVELLRRKGIIEHRLASNKEMLYLINKLSVDLSFDYVEDHYSLKPVFRDLKKSSDLRVPRWRAWLKHRYFANPWTTISLFAASLLLFLTALQTFYSVYSYYHPYFDGQI